MSLFWIAYERIGLLTLGLLFFWGISARALLSLNRARLISDLEFLVLVAAFACVGLHAWVRGAFFP